MFLLFALLLTSAIALQVLFACDDDDDDNDNDDNNDDDTPPLIPHGEQGACLECHADAHGGDYTSDQCLDCHAYAD
jgi:hypothetical protein